MILAAALGYWATTINPFNPLAAAERRHLRAAAGQYRVVLCGTAALLLPCRALRQPQLRPQRRAHRHRLRLRPYRRRRRRGPRPACSCSCCTRSALAPALLVPIALATPRRTLPIAGTTRRPDRRREHCCSASHRAEYNDFKAIYAPMHTPDAKQAAEIRSSRGFYALLDDFTERVDTDLSNNAGMLGVPGPPQSFGLYRDGSRIAALPKSGNAGADLRPRRARRAPPTNSAPNGRGPARRRLRRLRHRPSARPWVLTEITALEPDPVLLDAIAHGLGPAPATAADPRVHLSAASPLAITGRYDLVDIAGDFLDAGEANATSFSEEAIEGYLRALQPGGVISIPVSIREFPVYAVRVLATVRDALAGVRRLRTRRSQVVGLSLRVERPYPRREITLDRPSSIALVRSFCDDRSFDVSYYPGIDPVAAARANIYNDLPPIDFENGEVESSGSAQDAVADEAELVLRGQTSPSQQAFDLRPITLDRPILLRHPPPRPSAADPQPPRDPAAARGRPTRQRRRPRPIGRAGAARAGGAAVRPPRHAKRGPGRGRQSARSAEPSSISPASGSASSASRSS